jgi:hypothetical protein
VSYDFEIPNMTTYPEEMWKTPSIKEEANLKDYEEKYKFIIAKLITFKRIY